MNLTKILQSSCVRVPLKGKDKKEIITELIERLIFGYAKMKFNGKTKDTEESLRGYFNGQDNKVTKEYKKVADILVCAFEGSLYREDINSAVKKYLKNKKNKF